MYTHKLIRIWQFTDIRRGLIVRAFVHSLSDACLTVTLGCGKRLVSTVSRGAGRGILVFTVGRDQIPTSDLEDSESGVLWADYIHNPLLLCRQEPVLSTFSCEEPTFSQWNSYWLRMSCTAKGQTRAWTVHRPLTNVPKHHSGDWPGVGNTGMQKNESRSFYRKQRSKGINNLNLQLWNC